MFEPPAKAPSKVTFAKIAVILAATAGISFGLCTVGALTSTTGDKAARILGPLAMVCGALVVICIAGLILLGIVFIIKTVVDSFRNTENN